MREYRVNVLFDNNTSFGIEVDAFNSEQACRQARSLLSAMDLIGHVVSLNAEQISDGAPMTMADLDWQLGLDG